MMLKKAVFLTSVMLWGSTEAFTLLDSNHTSGFVRGKRLKIKNFQPWNLCRCAAQSSLD